MCSVFSTANGGLLLGGRLGYAMARDGLMFAVLGYSPRRLGTPAAGLIFLAAVSIVYVVGGKDFIGLLKQAAFAEVLFGALGAGAVILLRRRAVASPFRSPLHPLPALFYILVSAGMIAAEVATGWPNSMIVVVILVAAFPVYWVWRTVAGGETEEPGFSVSP
jgi:amino acid transporter